MHRARTTITKAEVAKMLGVSTTMVRHLAKQGKLRAVTKEDGVNYFDRIEVAALASQRAENPRQGPKGVAPAGKLAALAFEMLTAGTSPIELVKRLELTPQNARELVEQFNELRALEVSSARGSEVRCAICDAALARFCGGCVKSPAPAHSPSA